jgi:hypothetical protein
VGKSSPRIFATSEIFNKHAKETNRPKGENSPNLVTLIKPNVQSQCAYLHALQIIWKVKWIGKLWDGHIFDYSFKSCRKVL